LMTSRLKTDSRIIMKSIESIHPISAQCLQQVGLALLVSFFIASASSATNCFAQSKMTSEKSPETPNSLESNEKLTSVQNQISLVDWSPIYIDGEQFPKGSIGTLVP